VSLASLEAHMESNDGFCSRCKKWTNSGGCEPDARKYVCEECGRKTVYGAEEALIMGLVDGSEDGDDDVFDDE
jgi:tRNA(Ile2) C34 agmatinyltransferase TiaS